MSLVQQRLDQALVARGLARSRGQASELIRQGHVTVGPLTVTTPSALVDPDQVHLSVTDPYVSRAAHKLRAALDESGTTVTGRVLDVGASTGGFTQVCLERGADRVYAVDVGHGQLAAQLRADPRVIVREGLNARDLKVAQLDDALVDVIVADVSFISLTYLVAPLAALLAPGGTALLLVKPQFEVGRSKLGGRGLVTVESDRQAAVERVVTAAAEVGWRSDWRGVSRVPGSHGNREFFVRFRADPDTILGLTAAPSDGGHGLVDGDD